MAKKLRIATFNCENLFARYRFNKTAPADASKEGWDVNKTSFTVLKPEMRKLTRSAIKAVKADVLVLQEVENLEVLKRFRSKYLGGYKAYPYIMLVDANDPRKIDIGILSKYPLVHARSYQSLKEKPGSRGFVFSRDCLEVDVEVGNKTLTLFGNHFKSMMGGRKKTGKRRKLQADAVKKLIKNRFGTSAGDHPFVVLGDFNDYPLTDDEGSSSVTGLTEWNQVYDVLQELPEEDRWTHFYKAKKKYSQLDYILVSKSLKPAIQSVAVERRGLPPKADRVTGKRFTGVTNKLKASDHCPLVVELKI